MEYINQTVIMEFILLGFSFSNKTGFCLFVVITIVYAVTVMSNIFIIVIVINERDLHKPMYFFIGGLSFLEIWYPSVTVPKLLCALITNEKSISPAACISQFYFHFSCGATENFLLAVMAYDRYVAICHPLRYPYIMSVDVGMKLLVGCWVCGFTLIIAPCLLVSNLLFCHNNEIDHYYCDFAPLMKLSCSDISTTENLFFALACLVILGCFLPISVSYILIIKTIITFKTSSGKLKAFSTCASHLIVVALFYGTSIFMFIRPKSRDVLHLNKIVSIVPSIVTPLLNPIIYSLRNKAVKDSMEKIGRRLGFRKL